MSRHRLIVCVLIGCVTPAAWAAEEPGYETHADVVYARVDDRDLKLDLFVPRVAEGRRVPLVVWIHGGGWDKGNKRPCRALYLAAEGYAVASIDYRLSTDAVFPAQIHDCKAAIRYLRANADKYGYDGGRIGVVGASAGGHLSMLLGTTCGVAKAEGDVGDFDDTSSRVQAVVSLCGPSDLLTYEAVDPSRFVDLLIRRLVAERLVGRLLGGPPERKNINARLASPVHHVTPDDPPLLAIHGALDMLVPLKQSERMNRAYVQSGLDASLHVIEGGWHGGPAFTTREVRTMIADFFDRHLHGARRL